MTRTESGLGSDAHRNNWDDIRLLRLPRGESLAFLPDDPRSVDLLSRLHRSNRSAVRIGLSVLRSSPTAGRLLSAADLHHADSQARCRELLRAIDSLLGEALESVAFNVASDMSRATFAVLGTSGQTIFVKARSVNDTRLADMAEFLRTYRSRCPDVIVMPQLVKVGTYGRWDMVALSDVGSPQPTDGARKLGDLIPYLNAIRETSAQAMEGTQVLDALTATVDDCDAETAHLIGQLREKQGTDTVPLSLAHGDFVPWNMWHRGDVLHLWDWDKTVSRAPWPYDAIHYAFQTRRSLHGQSQHRALAGAMDDIRLHASELQAPELPTDTVGSFAFYAACRSLEERRLTRFTADGQWLVGSMSEQLR